jgi:hypothetical protein
MLLVQYSSLCCVISLNREKAAQTEHCAGIRANIMALWPSTFNVFAAATITLIYGQKMLLLHHSGSISIEKWQKITQNGQKRSKWVKMGQNGAKRAKTQPYAGTHIFWLIEAHAATLTVVYY